MNVQKTIESPFFLKWINDNIFFNPHVEYMSRGNHIQICHAMYKGAVIGSQRTYFPWNIFKDITEFNYGISIQESELPKEFKGFYYYEEDPYAEGKFWFHAKSFEAYVLAWMFHEQKELFKQFAID